MRRPAFVPQGTPVILTADASLNVGGTAQPDLSRLVPPSERSMLVQDVSFIVRSPSIATSRISSFPSLGFSGFFLPFIRAKLLIGRNSLTDGFVPLSNFGPRFSYAYDNIYYSGFNNGAATNGDLVVSESEIYNHRRWILPTPLYVAPGEMLQATFSFVNPLPTTFPAGMTTGWDVRIAIHGLLLAKPQNLSTRRVPYVSAFVPDKAQTKSGDLDLKNVLDSPLTIQRLVGQCWQIADNTVGPYDAPFFPNGITGMTRVKIKIEDTKGGYAITRTGQQASSSNFVDFFTVFPAQEPVLPFRRVLDLGEKVNVFFGDGGLFVEKTAGQNLITQLAYVSMVGYREEPVNA